MPKPRAPPQTAIVIYTIEKYTLSLENCKQEIVKNKTKDIYSKLIKEDNKCPLLKMKETIPVKNKYNNK